MQAEAAAAKAEEAMDTDSGVGKENVEKSPEAKTIVPKKKIKIQVRQPL